jgi:hypothetical protein
MIRGRLLGIEMLAQESNFQTTHPKFCTGWLDQFGDESMGKGICLEAPENLFPWDVKDVLSLPLFKASNQAT